MSYSIPRVFQLSQYDIDRSSTLEQSDLGTWCYCISGCIEGFHDSKHDAEEFLKTVMDWDSAS